MRRRNSPCRCILPPKLQPAWGRTEDGNVVYGGSHSGGRFVCGAEERGDASEFERKIKDGTVADCFHRIPVQKGDVMFLPSGRVHALGAGNVIFEIQQNSDTTYRVFDWNRVGLDGKPRELHVPESLASIDFDDFEPSID